MLPPSAPGMRIGLFGGSFNPVHEGHRLVALQAIKRLQLDALWVLVTPGNPLKSHADLAPLETRVQNARTVLAHPRIRVTGFEASHGFRYTHDTLAFLKANLGDRRFVWIMGADSLVGFHRWERWADIARIFPMAIYVRPGSDRRVPTSRAAVTFARYRRDESEATSLAGMKAPAWVYLHGQPSRLSSSAIRAAQTGRKTR